MAAERATVGIRAEVAVPLPLHGLFSYRVPADLAGAAAPGKRVLVPFGSRRLVGWIVHVREAEAVDLKDLIRIIDDEPLLSTRLLDLAARMARHCFCGPGEVLAAFVPAGVKKGARGKLTTWVRADPAAARSALADFGSKPRLRPRRAVLERLIATEAGMPLQSLLQELGVSDSPVRTLIKDGLVVSTTVEMREDPFSRLDLSPSLAPRLMAEQAEAARAIGASIEKGRHAAFLLHGVTGSGKTEVYLDAIGRCLAKNRGAIVLVPEISLTPQTLERFQSRFGNVAVLHSRLTDAERAAQWEEIRRGQGRIAIGPRSAIFAPVRDLGLIILDEEHETTFKQQNSPRYHARDVALQRGAVEDAVVVLGSATPSLEAWDAAARGRLHLLELKKRVLDRPLPEVSMIDMRSHKPMGPGGIFSNLLVNLIAHTLDRREQVLLFLNRRGFHTVFVCRDCGESLQCRDCAIPMTWYKSTNLLLCHYCNRSQQPPKACPSCKGPQMRFGGFGTETVEHAARFLFRNARIARMDGESMRARHSHEDLFRRLKNGEVDILVGTQMAAKGLDFPGITLIGVVNGDTSLLIPDFRSAERTFQLITQVAGRAGRGAVPGRVVVQTRSPDHYAFRAASAHDYAAFAEEEMRHRREAHYPPCGVLARVVFQGEEESRVIRRAEQTAQALRTGAAAGGISILGPSICPLAYVKRAHRHHLVLRADEGAAIEGLLAAEERWLRSEHRVQVLVDRDPTSMM